MQQILVFGVNNDDVSFESREEEKRPEDVYRKIWKKDSQIFMIKLFTHPRVLSRLKLVTDSDKGKAQPERERESQFFFLLIFVYRNILKIFLVSVCAAIERIV